MGQGLLRSSRQIVLVGEELTLKIQLFFVKNERVTRVYARKYPACMSASAADVLCILLKKLLGSINIYGNCNPPTLQGFLCMFYCPRWGRSLG